MWPIFRNMNLTLRCVPEECEHILGTKHTVCHPLLRQDHPMLQAEWMRVCDQQSMSRIDITRYALEPPPIAKQADPQAWRRAVENAEAQLEHQATRCASPVC